MRTLALAVCLLWAAPAFAVRTLNSGNVCIWWGPRGHSFQIDARGTPDVPGEAAFDAIRRSFQTWSGVSCSDLTFPDEGLSLDPKDRVVGYFPGRANHNLILFRTVSCDTAAPPGDDCRTSGGCENKYDCWDRGAGVIATTVTSSNTFTGQIVDADTELNDAPASDGSKLVFTANDGGTCTQANQTGCVRTDIQNTVTHELGHSLGLAHTPDRTATMFASAELGEVSKRTLGQDDLTSICGIYPKGQQTVTCLGGSVALTEGNSSNGSGGCGCSAAQTGPAGALCALAFLLRKRRCQKTP